MNFFWVQSHIEVTVDLYKASNHIFGEMWWPCYVNVLFHFACLWRIRLSQFELRIIAQIDKHLKIVDELAKWLWTDQNCVFLFLWLNSVVWQEVTLTPWSGIPHGTPAHFLWRIPNVNSRIHSVKPAPIFRIYYHAILIKVEEYALRNTPYLIHQLQNLYTWNYLIQNYPYLL